LLHNLGTCRQFGNTGRSIKLEESESSGSFSIDISTSYSSNQDRRKKSKKIQNKQQKNRTLPSNSTEVKSLGTIIIPPETMKKVKVKAQFNPEQEEGFVQRDFGFYRNQDEIYAVADCLIATAKPKLQVAHFSKGPITIHAEVDALELGVKHPSFEILGAWPGVYHFMPHAMLQLYNHPVL
jgi:hypothetical protein